ncbi:tyrosine-type recombinase/integrase [Bradyrhizobium sp. WSM1417]|uniref:tyrosine-type recombinase/integrase n=1 Tax=Bradyrhizobium sp. WSM1417 TaxID=754500 RepID=UPI0004BADD7F|nr:tyrosine-type recombinase/integrase [Bradyrhizobium sp. WSM1417]
MYWTGHVNRAGKALARPHAIRKKLDRLLDFFGMKVVGEITGPLQDEYAERRSAEIAEDSDKLPFECQSAPRRELEDLSAAINFALRKAGGASLVFRPTLPDDVEPRQRWLSRNEFAALLWTAWRAKGDNGHHSGKHVARFMLASIYTGSRAGDVTNAALMPTIGRGHIDLESGIFQRKPADKRATNKRQPTVPLTPRLLAHMRRWERKGFSNRFVIEYQGKPVKSFKTVWPSLVEAAGLATDDPAQKVLRHTLRHTAISWMLRKGIPIDVVSDYCGVSVAIIRKVYKHHLPGSFDPVLDAAHSLGRTTPMKRPRMARTESEQDGSKWPKIA